MQIAEPFEKSVLLLRNNRTLPPEFPLEMKDNAGNMVHANAAFSIVKHAKMHTGKYPVTDNVPRYVENHCSHIGFVFANALRMGSEEPRGFPGVNWLLKNTTKPIVVFGLGAQAASLDMYDAKLPASAIEMLKRLSDRCTTIGVRGEFTKKVLNHHGVTNVRVTGCPSLYSRLDRNFKMTAPTPEHGKSVAFSGTHYQFEEEGDLLGFAIKKRLLYVEPFFPSLYRAHKALVDGSAPADVKLPKFIETLFTRDVVNREEACAFFRDRFNLFRDMDAWLKFNREKVWFTFGTRFHVNMASLIAGVPALWVTHDSRTRELADFMSLPNCSIDEARQVDSPEELAKLADYQSFNSRYTTLYDNFVDYMNENGVAHNL